VAALVDALSAAPGSVAAAVGTAGGQRQVLPVAVRPELAAGPLAAAFARGVRSLRDGLAALAVMEVECGHAAPFADVDTPDDLRRASPRPLG
jgi:CTP:molybdopterin cytidylyltransferase MocA